MATYEDIAKSIKKRALKSVYLIAGDEPLFIDQLAEYRRRRRPITPLFGSTAALSRSSSGLNHAISSAVR